MERFVVNGAAGDREEVIELKVPAKLVAGGSGGRPSKAESEQIAGRILDTAKAIFLQEGFEKTSMDAIAADAGMSKRTLYTRFPSKSDLFEAIIDRTIEVNLAAIRSMSVTDRPLAEQLMALAERMIETLIVPDMIGIERIVIAESRRFPDLAGRIYQHGAQAMRKLIIDILKRASPPGASTAEDLERDTSIFMSLVLLPSLRQAMLGLGPMTVDKAFVRRSVEIFVQGFAPR